MEALTKLQEAFFAKGKEFDKVLKMGRTHLQDAVPMSLGQEFHGWGTTMGEEVQRIAEVRQFLHEINLGATAIGTTVTARAGLSGTGHQVPVRTHRLQVHPGG